jgi:hypothetical protein
LACSFSFLYERNFGIAFSDLNQFKVPKDLCAYGISFFDLEHNLGIFGNLIGAILGEPHRITMAYHTFCHAMSRQYRLQLQHEIDDRRVIKPTHILQNIQLICFHWFSVKRARFPPTDPNFLDIWQRIALAMYHTPLLPQPLYFLIHPHHQAPKLPGSASTSTALTGALTDVTNEASVAGSLISGVTGATGLSSCKTVQSSRVGALVTNESTDSHLLSHIPFNKKIKDIIGTTQPLTTEAEDPLCLSYHVKGACYSNCQRQKKHAHVLTHIKRNA